MVLWENTSPSKYGLGKYDFMCSPIFRMAVCTFPRDNRSPGLNKLSTCYYCVQFFSFFQNCINFSFEIFASGTVV